MLKRLLVLLLLVMMSIPAMAAEEPDHADHEELRALLRNVVQAINTEKYSDMLPYFHKNLRVTTVNQNVITTTAGLEPYFRDWIGPGRYVKKLTMTLTADDLTEFYGSADARLGVVRGSGTEDYDLLDGRHLPIKTRWTATVIKDTDGTWKILAMHIGTNFYDNPIFDAVQASTKYFAAGGFLLGLVCGGLLVWVRTKGKTRPQQS